MTMQSAQKHYIPYIVNNKWITKDEVRERSTGRWETPSPNQRQHPATAGEKVFSRKKAPQKFIVQPTEKHTAAT